MIEMHKGNKRLPIDRVGINHKINIGGYDFYLTVSTFEDGTPGELFISTSKAGSAMAGLCETISILMSMLLQRGVTVTELYHKFARKDFEPNGITSNKHIKKTKSIMHYILKWMKLKFPTGVKD